MLKAHLETELQSTMKIHGEESSKLRMRVRELETEREETSKQLLKAKQDAKMEKETLQTELWKLQTESKKVFFYI